MCLSMRTRPSHWLLNNRTNDSHYPWTKKWGAGQATPAAVPKTHCATEALPKTKPFGSAKSTNGRLQKPSRYRRYRKRDPFALQQVRGQNPFPTKHETQCLSSVAPVARQVSETSNTLALV